MCPDLGCPGRGQAARARTLQTSVDTRIFAHAGIPRIPQGALLDVLYWGKAVSSVPCMYLVRYDSPSRVNRHTQVELLEQLRLDYSTSSTYYYINSPCQTRGRRLQLLPSSWGNLVLPVVSPLTFLGVVFTGVTQSEVMTRRPTRDNLTLLFLFLREPEKHGVLGPWPLPRPTNRLGKNDEMNRGMNPMEFAGPRFFPTSGPAPWRSA